MKIVQLIDTLTGFEEIGIEQVCGKSLDELTDTGTPENPKAAQNTLLVRSMAAVVIARRDEISMKQAWEKVLAMPRTEVGDLFPDEDEPDEVLEDEPVTDSGKDDSESESEPPSSPQSSSTPA